MMEIPEAVTVARQVEEVLAGRRVRLVRPGNSPHKFAWFSGDPAGYGALLEGRALGRAAAYGGLVELELGEARLMVGDGTRMTYVAPGERPPAKCQLLVEFEDDAALACSVQMYGGMWAHRAGEDDNPYHLVAKEKPSPLGGGFDRAWFDGLLAQTPDKLSAKAFLATEQRIPGLGNGVLQDILFTAGVNPKKKLAALSGAERDALYTQTKQLLAEMTAKGGRDTERDLFGCSGGYQTLLSAKTANRPCPVCGAAIVKQAYMGGSVYFCPQCQGR